MPNEETIPVQTNSDGAANANKRKPTPPKLVKMQASPYPVQTLTKLPETRGRSIYGWNELKKPKQFKRIPAAKIDSARTSAYAYAKANDFAVTILVATDENGVVIPLEDEKGNTVMGDNGKPRPGFYNVIRMS